MRQAMNASATDDRAQEAELTPAAARLAATVGLGKRAQAVAEGPRVSGSTRCTPSAVACSGVRVRSSRALDRPAPDSSRARRSQRRAPTRVLSTIECLNTHTGPDAPEASAAHDTVLVVDFGAQYAELIARRVRELSVYSEIVPHRISARQVVDRAPAAIILSGGPASVNIEGTPRLDPEIYELGIPILGICYGAQLIATQLGGTVGRGMAGEYGRARLRGPPNRHSSPMTSPTRTTCG